MAHLNYNHLHYFWVVATLGSIAKAAEALHVTPQTISGQLRTLESQVGSSLFKKAGRGLELTETGQVVRSYAEPMFNLGLELGDVLKAGVLRESSPLSVGVATGVPSLITYRTLAPTLDLPSSRHVVCYEAPIEDIARDLRARKLDIAITDGPITSTHSVQVQSQVIGQCSVTFFCANALAERYQSRFPRSLDGAPFVMPAKTSALREVLLDWFQREQVAPLIVADVENPDLMSALCETKAALFALPTAIAGEVERRYQVSAVGCAPTARLLFYATCAKRQLGHELISSIIDGARGRLLASAVGRVPVPDTSRSSHALLDRTRRPRAPCLDPGLDVRAAVCE